MPKGSFFLIFATMAALLAASAIAATPLPVAKLPATTPIPVAAAATAPAPAASLTAVAQQQVPAPAQRAPGSFADLAEKLTPAVVNIATTQKIKTQAGMNGMGAVPPGMEEFQDFFEQFQQQFGANDMPSEREVFSLGSGFIIDPSGIIVTNNHMIGNGGEIAVVLSDNTKLKAKVLGRDVKSDIAVLKVDARRKLPFVSFGNSDVARVGDWVLAIGNPFGLGGTVTAGIISARARNINAGPFDDFIQTDAAINRGNSGGPMFNMAGEVIGINTAIFSPTGTNIGIGFAIPSNLARPVIDQLKAGHTIRRGWLGVKIQGVGEEAADSLGMKEPSGVLVLDVTEGSPADKAGIEPGDVIVKYDGKTIGDKNRLPRLVAEASPGRKVPVAVLRDKKVRTLTVTLGEAGEKAEQARGRAEAKPPLKGISKSHEMLGMGLAELTPQLRDYFHVPASVKGLAVVEVAPESEAYRRGIRYGDVIAQVNEVHIGATNDLVRAFKQAREAGRKFVLLRVVRGSNALLFLTVPVE